MRNPAYSRWLADMFVPNLPAIPHSRQFLRFLLRGLRDRRNPRLRYICAYHSDRFDDSRLQAALCGRAGDPDEHPVIRGQCLERLKVWCRNRREARRVREVLLRCLGDPDPNVRFWACFKAPAWALPVLQKLVDDQGVGDLGWTVGYEAGQAILAIRGLPAWEGNGPKRLAHGYRSFWLE